jgi:serine protease Do
MLHYKKNILCFFILFLLLGISSAQADHTYKTSIVKRVLSAVVEIHTERGNSGADQMRPQDSGGFQFRNKPQRDSRNRPQERPNPKQDPTHLGSGFVISSDGYILTNAHVVNNIFDGGKIKIIFNDDKAYEASLVNYDEDSDIALLKINNAEFDKVFEYVKWGETPELGDDVIAIGSPMGQSFTVTFGNVSSLNRFIPNSQPFVPYIQTDAAINPGNSGGPLFNSSGEVVGINTMILTGGSGSKGNVGIGFAIDGDYVQSTVEQLMTGEKITRPYMGIVFRPVTIEDMENFEYGYGAYIEEIVPDSPANGILKVGDIILSIDGEKVKWRLLATKVKSKKIGDIAQFIILRDRMEIPLTFVMSVMK